MANSTVKNARVWERQAEDWYVEPEWCSERLLYVEKFSGYITDPACGMGRIVQSALKHGYFADGSDIVSRSPVCAYVRDFLSDKFVYPKSVKPDIISNPPFDLFEQFARKAITICDGKVAMLWLVRRLVAARWLQETPLARVWLLTPRPSMPPGEVILRGDKPGNGTQDFCWLVWDKNYKGQPHIAWLHRDGKQ